ncbi:LIM/homeobox protein Lhx9-like [Anopheles aquasalis]|uniref:LIM/homeobox protein Lhx9-like n=1 Tax=Anopheles aquasalis TaxID=42839 RepID=UPI00215B5E19|nr:LIM/homeobox protein Lhx9-like [Anopheles aquasalis]
MLKDLMASEAMAPEKCAGCGSPIRDRYYLLVADRAWHNQCLRCCKCLHNLEAELSCYSREGNIYCKDDYYRHFSARRCARCRNGISASDLVMRAKDLIFHVNCFSCLVCGQLLRGGDTAGIRDGRVFCGEHYESDVLSEPETISPQFFPVTTTSAVGPTGHTLGHAVQPSQKGRPRKRKLGTPQPPPAGLLVGDTNQCPGQQQHHEQHQHPPTSAIPPPPSGLQPSPQQQQQQQQSTPPQALEALDPGTAPLRLDLLHKELSVNSLDLSTYDGSQSPGSGGTLTPNCRTKRMRTSFKHHQLRTMKSYFAINQNPDAKDLKQLAQKTGLSKRVLQVWFQNARAKWRRNVMRQDGVMGNPGQTLTGLPSIATATLHHHHTGGNPNDGVHDLSSTQVLEEMHNMTFAELY